MKNWNNWKNLAIAGATSLATLTSAPLWAQPSDDMATDAQAYDDADSKANKRKADRKKADRQNKEGERRAAEPTTEAFDSVIRTRIFFAFDKSMLTDEGRQALDETATWLIENDGRQVLIEGHTDEVGPDEYNQELGRERAEAARNYLTAKGVSPAQIRILSYGEEVPAVEDPGINPMNRRVLVFGNSGKTTQPQRMEPVEPEQQAMAEPEPQPQPAPAPMTMPMEEPEPVRIEKRPRPRLFSLMVGAGAMGFTGDEARDITDVGGAWDARVAIDGGYVGLEAAYRGSAQDLNMPSFTASDTALIGNGAEGNVRLNFTKGKLVQPFVFGGVGWTNYNIVNENADEFVFDDVDNIVHIPAGAGLAFNFDNSMLLDIRGDYRAAFDDDLFEAETGDGDLDSWSASARLGWKF